MLHLILKSYTDEGFGRNVYKNVFFLSLYIYIYIYIQEVKYHILETTLNRQMLSILCLLFQVRGVGAGGIVSSCYCLLFKLFTLKLTRKQLKGLLDHCDSPYIRGIGFMYIR